MLCCLVICCVVDGLVEVVFGEVGMDLGFGWWLGEVGMDLGFGCWLFVGCMV